MWIFRWPTSLWFLGGGSLPGEVAVCVSATYKVSCAVDQISSVDVDLSTFQFGLSAEMLAAEENGTASVMVGIDLDDNAYSTLDLKASITPVYVIDQSGQIQACVSTDYRISASITASIFPDVVPSVTYQLSASLSVGISVQGEILVCVSTNYLISASIGVLLQVQAGQEDKNISTNYGVSASITPRVAIVNQGGLVWSLKKQRYIAVRVGSVTG